MPASLTVQILIGMFEKRPHFMGISESPQKKRKVEDQGRAKKAVGGWMYIGSHNFSGAAWVRSFRCPVYSSSDRGRSTSKAKTLF